MLVAVLPARSSVRVVEAASVSFVQFCCKLQKTLQASFEGLNRTVWVVLNKAIPDVIAPLKRSADELNLEVLRLQ